MLPTKPGSTHRLWSVVYGPFVVPRQKNVTQAKISYNERPMNETRKYYALHRYLQESQQDQLTLSLEEIEALLDHPLPATARSSRAWWSNRSDGSVPAAAWMEAGYLVDGIDLDTGQITFRKQGVIIVYNIRRDGDTVLWNGELIKALREYMGLTQREMADELGVRQQTISEWETGAYEPKRSTSKYLSLVAERAGFTYE
jgi:DNA-binding XRE family transcriptional regulator